MQYIKTKKELITVLKPLLPQSPTILEAGAFDGKDTLFLHSAWPDSTIHAFEPVAEIYERLVERTKPYPAIHTYPLALAQSSGTQEFFIAEKPENPGVASQAGSLLKPKERLRFSSIHYPKMIQVSTITLDEWQKKYQINAVDFIWLDVQGMALPILEHAKTLLPSVKALWIEVEFIEAYEGQKQYQDVVRFLQEEGFEIMAQDFTDTDQWFFGNVLALKGS
jgi:FkbM family methyltransferase